MVFEILFEKVNKFYERIFYKYGLFISKYHVYIIIASFILNAILTCGIFKFELIKDTDELFMLTNSEARKDEKFLKRLFNSTEVISDEFYLHQTFDFGTGGEINFHVRKNRELNILQRPYVDEIRDIHRRIYNSVNVTIHNRTYRFEDLCAKRNGKCWVEGAGILNERFFEFLRENSIKMRNKNKTEVSRKLSYDERLYFDSKTGMLTELGIVLGKDFRYSADDDKTHAYARILKLRYQLKYNHDTTDVKAKLWELEFLKFVKALNTTSLAFTYSTSKSLEDEIASNITFDAILVTITFILITIFATLFMSIKSNMITSPGMVLPAAGIFSALFGVSSATGFLAYVGYPGCNLVFIIPFLVIGIGIDDMFLIYASFTRTSSKLGTQERISLALEKIGVSVTITSLTDFTAFIVGMMTGFKSVRIFCIYAAFSIFFCYVYQLTFFSGWLVVHSNRIKANRNTLLWCIKYKTDDEDSCEMKQVANGNKTETEDSNVYGSTTVDENEMSSLKTCLNSISEHFKAFYKFLITHNYGKCIVGVVFLIYIGYSSWNVYKIREGIDIADLVSGKSYFREFTKENLNLFEMEPVVMMVIHEPIDYTLKENRLKIKRVLTKARTIPGIDKDFLLNWMAMFSDELKQLARHGNKAEEILGKISGTKSPFSNDIIVNTFNRSQIKASRFFIKYDRVLFNSKDAEPMYALEKLCSESGLPILAFAVTFKFYEQFEQTLPNIIQAFIVATEAMYLISLIFIPDLRSALCIVLSMIAIMVGLIGFMNVWNLSLSSITMIEVIMSVGFCIDFSAHITHAFIAGVGKGTRSERAYKACIKTGLPILNSAISSIIGVSVLAFAESYIFQSFFKTMFLVMSLGLLTSMLFLPVLLSICGPHWKRHYKEIDHQHRHRHCETEEEQTAASSTNPLIE